MVAFGFEGLKCRATSFRVAAVALCDIPTCLRTCQKSFCVTGAILLQGSPKMTSIFSGKRNTLEVSIHCAWQAQYFGHFCYYKCRFLEWHGCIRYHIAIIFRIILNLFYILYFIFYMLYFTYYIIYFIFYIL